MGSQASNDSFSQDQGSKKIPLMQLVCTNCTMSLIPLDPSSQMRAVVISDTHLGKYYPAESTIQKLFNFVTKIVKENNANYVFWLGDIFDTKARKEIEVGQKFIDTFSTFQVPIHFISGNHDRFLYKKLNVHGSINYCPSKIMKIISPITKQALFFGHDLGNAYKLSNIEVPSFIWSNKIAQKKMIKLENWFIIGHTHFLYMNKAKRIASLAPFSVDMNNFCYGLVVDGEKRFEISFHSLETESNIASKVKKIQGNQNDDCEEINQ